MLTNEFKNTKIKTNSFKWKKNLVYKKKKKFFLIFQKDILNPVFFPKE